MGMHACVLFTLKAHFAFIYTDFTQRSCVCVCVCVCVCMGMHVCYLHLKHILHVLFTHILLKEVVCVCVRVCMGMHACYLNLSKFCMCYLHRF